MTNQLKGELYHLTHYVEPVVAFCLQFGDGGCPLIENLSDHHSQFVNGDKIRSAADTWAALAQLPPHLWQGVEGIVKMNWNSEFVKFGVCSGVSTSRILNLKHGRGKKELESLHSFLESSRAEMRRELSQLPFVAQVTIKGKLDVWAARSVVSGKFETCVSTAPPKADAPDAETDGRAGPSRSAGLAETLQVRVQKLTDVTPLLLAELMVARGESAIDDEKLGPILLKMSGKDSQTKKKELTTEKERPMVPKFDAAGNVNNYKDLVEKTGVRKGSIVQAKEAIGTFASKFQKGKILLVDDKEVSVEFGAGKVKVWPLGGYPHDLLQVVSLDGEDSQAIEIPEGALRRHAFFGQVAWNRSLKKAQIVCGLDIFAHASKSAGFDMEEWVKVEMLPKKKVMAKRDIAPANDSASPGAAKFYILPHTNRLGQIEKDLSGFLKTSVEVPGAEPAEVITLQDPNRYSICTDEAAEDAWQKQNGPFVLEVFWRVQRQTRPGMCNMEIRECVVNTTGAVTLCDNRMAGGCRAVSLPVMIPSKEIKAGEELVLHYQEKGAKLEPAAKP